MKLTTVERWAVWMTQWVCTLFLPLAFLLEAFCFIYSFLFDWNWWMPVYFFAAIFAGIWTYTIVWRDRGKLKFPTRAR